VAGSAAAAAAALAPTAPALAHAPQAGKQAQLFRLVGFTCLHPQIEQENDK
jgi:hypothetical protein